MNYYGKFCRLLLLWLLTIQSIQAQEQPSAVFWQQQHYLPVMFDFNQDQVPDLLLQAKSEGMPSLLVIGKHQQNDVLFLAKNSVELPLAISGLPWSAANAQILPLRNQAQGNRGLLVIFPARQSAVLLAANETSFDFSRPIAKYQAAQWPFLASVIDYELHAGDFDNDGIDEILQLAKVSGEHQIVKIQGNYSLATQHKAKKKLAWGLQNKARIIIHDFDNNGRADIFSLAKKPGSSH
jgi:hypothetical protein